ncbi:MAG: transglycosylase domain-containing protein, partial [Acidobacteriota bacterium]
MRKNSRRRRRRYSSRRLKLTAALLAVASALLFSLAAFVIFHTLRFSHRIDVRLAGEREERPTWIYARPFELRVGQRISAPEVVEVLNALRYREVGHTPDEAGTFRRAADDVLLHPRGSRYPARVSFRKKWIAAIRSLSGGTSLRRIELGPVPITTLFGTDRIKKRWTPLEGMPEHLVQAVVATEDRRFFEHTGLDPIGILRAAIRNLRSRELQQGGSTLSQQLVKSYFLTPEKTLRRKLLEAFLAIILETRTSKEEILELYLNDVYLGQRGSFGISGVGQAAQIFFGKHVRNVELEEAALIAAVIRSPNRASPFRHPDVARERRDVVLSQMARLGFIEPDEAQSAQARPLRVEPASLETGEAPYFVDGLRRDLLSRHPPETLRSRDLSIYSTLDRYLQTAAQRAVTEGLQEIEKKLGNRRTAGTVQTATLAMDPSTGDVLALVGGRSYGASQFNRALDARRQPGSAFKPFVYLAAFEQTYRELRLRRQSRHFTPASRVRDEPTTFRYGDRIWSPQNYARRV